MEYVFELEAGEFFVSMQNGLASEPQDMLHCYA